MVTQLLAKLRERVTRRPDSEHVQALFRLMVVGIGLLYVAWMRAHDPDGGNGLWVTTVASAAFSTLLFAHIVWKPDVSPARRIVGALHDNVTVTIWLYMAGPLGALYIFVYPFVTVGNGFRFGAPYLAVSGLLGAVGIASLVAFAPGWQGDRTIGLGIFICHVFVTGYIGLLLARMHRLQRQLQRMATHDPLTGLPNRRLFLDTLSRMLADEHRDGLACLYLDLDGFKVVNDRCGHAVGDRLLEMVAETISGCVRRSDLTARLGGDEFATILVELTSPDSARLMAQRIIRAVSSIAEIDGHAVEVSASVGIAFLSAEAQPGSVSADVLVRSADEAMYRAKKTARGQLRLVDWSSDSIAALVAGKDQPNVQGVPGKRIANG